MKPFISFLRIAMVCVLAFFLYAVVRKPAPRTLSQPEPQPRVATQPQLPVKQQYERATPTPPVRVSESRPEPSSAVAETVPKVIDERPRIRPIPALPSSAAADILTVMMQECHRSGEEILCFGTARNNAEIPQEVNLQDSNAVDDQGRSFLVYLFGGGLRFDTGWNQKLLPGVPVRFYVKIEDPYPRVKTVNLAINFSIEYRRFNMVFKDYPVQ